MSKYSIDSTTLTGIADAIRAKDGSSSPIVVSDFATKIANISTSVNGGDDSSISNLPYDLAIRSVAGQTKIIGSSYQNYGVIVIPYSVWSKFSSINFNYSIYTVSQPRYDVYSCQIQVLICWATYNESQTWNPKYFGYSSFETISTLISDCEGSVSSTYNLDCTSLTPPSDTKKDLIILVQLRKKPDTDYPSHTFHINIGNFKGVKA
jgi:hypothetical protein